MIVKSLVNLFKSPPVASISRKMLATTVIDPVKMKLVITPELEKLVDIFSKYNYEVRIAGGAVRDLISGEKIPDDVDLATVATPEQMKDMFAKESVRTINEQGEKHGTVTVRIDDKSNYEVTTLRIDKVTDGRHAEVEFTTDWMLDAERRDLTVNSMFMGIDGTVYDYFNGMEDLKKKRIAFVGSADARIKEDYLRILRYFRFYGRIADREDIHEDATLEAIRQNAAGLQRISGERIWSEWKKILSGPMGGPLTIKMVEVGLSPYIGLPENPNVTELERMWQLRKNTLHHVTLLSHLLRTQDEMTKLNLRLKMSAYERDLGMFLLQHRDAMQTLKYWQKVLLMTKLKPSSVREWIMEAIKIKEQSEDLHKVFQNWEAPQFPINGLDLKSEGVPPGKGIGFCMLLLKEAWIDSDFSYDRDHLLKVELPKAIDAFTEQSRKKK